MVGKANRQKESNCFYEYRKENGSEYRIKAKTLPQYKHCVSVTQYYSVTAHTDIGNFIYFIPKKYMSLGCINSTEACAFLDRFT